MIKEKKNTKGISAKQSHRLLENLQRVALLDAIEVDMTELHKKIAALRKEEHDAMGNAITGMLEGNVQNNKGRQL